MEWVTLDLTLPHEMVDALTEFCVENGSRGVVLRDDDPDLAGLTAYFSIEHWNSVKLELEAYLLRLGLLFPELPVPAATTSSLADENWAIVWRDHFKSLPVGKHFIVTPPWLEPDPGERHVIIIDPAEAFGTGTHETTQGCLILLEEAVHRIAEKSDLFTMLDVGCGSGILAIAAAKLGAQRVIAVDNDSMAIKAAQRNIILNREENKILVTCLSLEQIRDDAHIVAANLDQSTILSNKTRLIALCQKFLILSGVTLDQWEEVKAELATGPLCLVREITKTEWGAGLFGRQT
jgi:ribosomal protein L11 methyltransferase